MSVVYCEQRENADGGAVSGSKLWDRDREPATVADKEVAIGKEIKTRG